MANHEYFIMDILMSAIREGVRRCYVIQEVGIPVTIRYREVNFVLRHFWVREMGCSNCY